MYVSLFESFEMQIEKLRFVLTFAHVECVNYSSSSISYWWIDLKIIIFLLLFN